MATSNSTFDTVREHRGVQIAIAAAETAGLVAVVSAFMMWYAIGIVVVNEVFANAGVALSPLEQEVFAVPGGVPVAVVLGLLTAHVANLTLDGFGHDDGRIDYMTAALAPAGVWLLVKGVHIALLARGVL